MGGKQLKKSLTVLVALGVAGAFFYDDSEQVKAQPARGCLSFLCCPF